VECRILVSIVQSLQHMLITRILGDSAGRRQAERARGATRPAPRGSTRPPAPRTAARSASTPAPT
jgi:hypothetical protein